MKCVSKRIAALFTAAFMMMTSVAGYALDAPAEGLSQVHCTCDIPCTGDIIDTDCPVCAGEDARPEDCGKFMDSGKVTDSGPPPIRRAARAAGIDMTMTGYVFAQGTPIVIRDNGGITSIYDENGALLSGKVNVSDWTIFGGWFSSESVYSDTSVVMESGRASIIYGGNSGGVLEGNTSVTINGGAVGWVYGGGYFGDVTGAATVTVNSGAKIWGNHFMDNSAPDDEKGTVFGGGLGGSVNTARVIFDGGDSGWIYGGGETYDTFTATAQDASVTLKSGSCNYVYGGSLKGEVGQTSITLNADWDSLYWLNAGGYDDTTVSARVFIQDNRTSSAPAAWLNIQGGTAQKTAITARRGSGGGSGSDDLPKLNLSVIDVQEIAVEYGDVNLMATSGLIEELFLDRLEVQPAGRVRFQDWKTVEIGTLAGSSGKIVLPAHRKSGTGQLAGQTPVTVGTIAVDTPLMLETAGTNWSDSELQQCVFFQGPAVEALNSPAGIFDSVDYKVQLRQKPDGGKGIYLATRGYRQSVVLSKLSFNQNPSVYNGTLPVTVGVTTQGNWASVLPGAHLQIRSAAQNQILADVQVNGAGDEAAISYPDGATVTAAVENGGITFPLPVRAAILDTSEEGLDLVFLATDDYYDASTLLQGPSGETKLQITPAQVAFTDVIPEPAFGQTTTVPLKDGPFFTVKAVWRRPNGIAASSFVVGDYQADLILTPKPGHRLSQRSIGDTVSYNGQEYGCIFNADGTVTLESVKNATVPGCVVTVAASPAEGGAVTGGGTYDPGAKATVKAVPNSGYRFTEWQKDGVRVSTDPEYTFTVRDNQALTAVFEAIRYTVTVAASPAEGGAVTGGGSYREGAQVTVTAAPAAGYVFLGWTEDGVEVSGLAAYTFAAAKDRALTAVFQKEDSQIKVVVGQGLTQVPEGLENTEFNTIEKIIAELQRRVKAAISGVGDRIVIYDVQLQYLDENGQWQPVDPAHFPAEGVTATLPYPAGTNGSDYTFTVQHMISYGPQAGTVETMAYTALEDGLWCHFTSLSPVAVGYRHKSSPIDPERPSNPGGSGGSGGSNSSNRDDEFDFWESVRRRIESANPGDTIKVNARNYDRMPRRVMDALKQRGSITLIIRWSGGKDIIIPAGLALDEALRLYYPLSYLEAYGFVQALPLNPETGGVWETEYGLTQAITHPLNPETGGVWEIEATPTTDNAPKAAPSQKGLAETPEPAYQSVRQAVPGNPQPIPKITPFLWTLAGGLLAAAGWYLWRRNGHKKKNRKPEND